MDFSTEKAMELVHRYNKPGPRYTSYPTAPEWTESFGPEQYAAVLKSLGPQASLYIHIPFCESRCFFCACNVVITRHKEQVEKYVDYLKKELVLLRKNLTVAPSIHQLHLGGGTPNYLTSVQLRGLYAAITEVFPVDSDAEKSLEIDPRTISYDQLDTLRELGFNRISFGVQDFNEEVQKSVNRIQPKDLTSAITDYCKKIGFHSVHFDLIYGLPRQTMETFRQTIQRVINMAPQRLSIYSYAHVPWLRAHQKYMNTNDLPKPEEKSSLFLLAQELLLQADYQWIGLDHFSLKTDELYTGLKNKTLYRNFMGYTTKRTRDLIPLGISAIGEISGHFTQNSHKLSSYYEALEKGIFPTKRGLNLTRDDLIRKDVIQSLGCQLKIDFSEFETKWGISFPQYFGAHYPDLEIFAADNLLQISDRELRLLPLGQLFMRNVCMLFDAYLRKKSKPQYSQTV